MKAKLSENNIVTNYYKISLFINKYITLIIGFLIASIFFIGIQNKNYSIIQYSKTDIINKINNNTTIGKNINNFNKNDYIKSNLIITNSSISGNTANLLIGVFKTKKDNIILPINSKIIIKSSKTNIPFEKIYILNLKNSKLLKNNFNIRNKKGIDKKTLIKKYNLGCTKTYLNNNIFCEINKKKVIKDIINGKNELNSKAYNYLFSKLNLDDKEKCNLLVNIFNKKYNLNNIKFVSEKYCSDEIYNKMLDTIDIYKYVIKNLFGEEISSNQDINILKLVKQEQVLLVNIRNKKTISKNNLIMYLTLIKNILKSGISEKNAILTKNILLIIKKYIKNNNITLYNLIKKDISKVINGDNLGNKGLNNFIKRKQNENNDNIDNEQINIIKTNIISNKEKIKNIFNKYNNIFVITNKIKELEKNKKYEIEGIITLNFENNGKIVNKQVNISMNIENIIGKNFDITDIQIENTKLSNYIKKIGYEFNNINSIIKLKQILEEKLYDPLFLNNYGDEKSNINLCDKVNDIVKSIKGSCNNGTIIAPIKDKNIIGNLNITFKIDNLLNISNIELDTYNIEYKNKVITLNFKTKNIEKEEILKLDISKSKKIFGKLIGNSISMAGKIINLENKLILKEKENTENKLINLSNNEIIEINNSIKSKLGGEIKLIRYSKGNDYKLYFTKDGILFLGLYDKKKNIINNLIILIPKKNKYFIFKNTKLSLSNLNTVNTNSFKYDIKKYLENINPENINPENYNKYIKFTQKK